MADRREFFAALAALALEARTELLPTPDFGRVKGYRVGIRPYRRSGFRLERERIGETLVVHDYGHGGAGVTLSWGCAEEAVRMLREVVEPPAEIALLGAGVIGLSTARVLQEQGYGVVLFSAEYSPQTTSDVAGAQFAPSLVAYGPRRRFERVLSASYRRFHALVGADYGVAEKPNYATPGRGRNLDRVAHLIPPVERLDRLPFAGTAERGALYRTLHIDPPYYLPTLMADFYAAGGTSEDLRVVHLDQVRDLPQRAVMNCLGLGAAELFADRSMVPIRGQLVLLEPQDLPWMLNHGGGYIFPRRDGVVLGGSTERGQTELVADPGVCRGILRRNRAFFQ